MDQKPQVFDENLKKEVEKALVEKIISALESKQINLAQMKIVANYILDNIDSIKNYSQFILFLENLQKQWPIFIDIYVFYKNKSSQEKEKMIINKLSNYIDSYK